MEQSLLILGRQPALGLAELESLYGDQSVRLVGQQAALVSLPANKINFLRLGGSLRLCQPLVTLKGRSWAELEAELVTQLPSLLGPHQGGKWRLGISTAGLAVSPKQLLATSLKLKKVIQKNGQSLRFIPSNNLQLNTAQVIHNRLVDENGLELYLVRDKHQTLLARTLKVQDIKSYGLRDYGRPKRDSRVGMLPPKLAQIIINLANPVLNPDLKLSLLDPFCGTGVLLQEGLLMGYKAVGSDLAPKMIDYSQTNLKWLEQKFRLPPNLYQLHVADATNYAWPDNFNFVASETYLGRPFTNQPSASVLQQTIDDCNLIISKFLTNLARQLASGARLCIAVPAWQDNIGQFKHLPFIDQLSDLGYNRVSFKDLNNDQLLYYREKQIVGRELLVLIRK